MNSADGQPLEIERKYLIRLPNPVLLSGAAERVLSIRQIYLMKTESGGTSRVRQIRENGEDHYFFTEKKHITDVIRVENEHEISYEEFERLALSRDSERRMIEKTRYCVPFGGHTLEIDVFPFWQHQAYCEIELSTAEEEIVLPDWIEVIREVTADRHYTNSSLALSIPPEG